MARPTTHNFDLDMATSLYASGLSTGEIAAQLGVPDYAIAYRLKLLGLLRPYSNSRRIYAERLSKVSGLTFAHLNPDTAWLLGLIFGDGHLHNDGYGFEVVTSEPDIPDKIRAIAGKATSVKKEGCVAVRVYSLRVIGELCNIYGLQSNKTQWMFFPKLPDRLIPHFVRGLIDSDGSWFLQKANRVLLSYCSACGYFVQQLRDTVSSITQSSRIKISESRPGQFQMGWCWSDSVAIGDWLYGTSSCANRSDRKYEIWKSASDSPGGRIFSAMSRRPTS